MKIRDFIGATARAGAEREQQRGMRRLISGAARLAKTNPADLIRMASGMGEALRVEQEELGTWIDPGETEGRSEPAKFDVCDLRIWLELTEAAEVDFIPAQTVASLSKKELEALLGSVAIPEVARRRITEGMMDESGETLTPQEAESVVDLLSVMDGDAPTEGDAHPGHRAFAKIEGALDEIPASWMVRTHLAGSGNLKALVGCGLMQKADDTAQVRPDFEIGGGWVRTGNRRMIDFSDPRFLQTAIGGHKTDIHYLARPWAQPGRFHEGEDLHRAGTPIAGNGLWPAEWRVFVRSGQVTGVANYYGWTGDGATPESAWNAIEAAAQAQKIVDVAEDRGLEGVFMPQVFIRKRGKDTQTIDVLDRDWPEGRMHCTLDFLETDQGLRFLEAGPAHQPGGGGHPCAFAGQNMEAGNPRSIAACEGIAYRSMPHVHLGDTSTWVHGDDEGCIEDWGAAAKRAADFQSLSDDAREFLERIGVTLEDEVIPNF